MWGEDRSDVDSRSRTGHGFKMLQVQITEDDISPSFGYMSSIWDGLRVRQGTMPRNKKVTPLFFPEKLFNYNSVMIEQYILVSIPIYQFHTWGN